MLQLKPKSSYGGLGFFFVKLDWYEHIDNKLRNQRDFLAVNSQGLK